MVISDIRILNGVYQGVVGVEHSGGLQCNLAVEGGRQQENKSDLKVPPISEHFSEAVSRPRDPEYPGIYVGVDTEP